MEHKRDLVIGIGEVLWDMLPQGRQAGGAPANFAYHVSQFGIRSVAVSALGNDVAGSDLRETLGQKGLELMAETVDFPTGTVNVMLDGNGVPSYDIVRDTAWDNIPYSEALRSLAERARVVCFGSLAQRSPVSRNTIASLLRSLPDEVYKVFDINLRQDYYSEEVIISSLKMCNVLKINDEELVILGRMTGTDTSDVSSACRKIMSVYDIDTMVLTCGATGSYAFDRDNESYIATPRVTVADTVGAGDSFTAAFMSSLLAGSGLSDAHRKAVEVSAYVCTQKGAMPVLPHELVSVPSRSEQ